MNTAAAVRCMITEKYASCTWALCNKNFWKHVHPASWMTANIHLLQMLAFVSVDDATATRKRTLSFSLLGQKSRMCTVAFHYGSSTDNLLLSLRADHGFTRADI